MGSHAAATGDEQHKNRDVVVLLTGFGPFQQTYPINPSYEIIQSLPKTIPTAPDGKTQIQLVTYDTPIRVAYANVRKLVPNLLSAYSGTVDIVLHLGMASGRDYYTIEQYAQRDGYNRSFDVDHEKLPVDDGLVRFGDCPPTLTTSLDFHDVLKRWQLNALELEKVFPSLEAKCRPSKDAGRYLCDYIYFNSLAWFGRRNSLEGTAKTDRPVMFLHVPAESDPETVAQGVQVTIALIRAMVDQWQGGA